LSNNEEVQDHLSDLRNSINDEINVVNDYMRVGSKMTAGNRAAELLKVTTIPAASLHASNCSICSTWDGSVGDD